MRKGDMEWVEMHLEPLTNRITSLVESHNKLARHVEVLEKRTKDMKRDHKANVLAVDQACNSARSLLQQANRRMKEAKIIPDDEEVAEPEPAVNTPRTADQVIADARARNAGRTVL